MNEYEILVSKIEEINVQLKEIRNKQEKIEQQMDNNNRNVMRRINKLQDYNEISDMQSKITYNQMNELANWIKAIDEKLY